jgi:hypothetical protein
MLEYWGSCCACVADVVSLVIWGCGAAGGKVSQGLQRGGGAGGNRRVCVFGAEAEAVGDRRRAAEAGGGAAAGRAAKVAALHRVPHTLARRFLSG